MLLYLFGLWIWCQHLYVLTLHTWPVHLVQQNQTFPGRPAGGITTAECIQGNERMVKLVLDWWPMHIKAKYKPGFKQAEGRCWQLDVDRARVMTNTETWTQSGIIPLLMTLGYSVVKCVVTQSFTFFIRLIISRNFSILFVIHLFIPHIHSMEWSWRGSYLTTLFQSNCGVFYSNIAFYSLYNYQIVLKFRYILNVVLHNPCQLVLWRFRFYKFNKIQTKSLNIRWKIFCTVRIGSGILMGKLLLLRGFTAAACVEHVSIQAHPLEC